MDEILLRGAIESLHLHDGQLEVTMGGHTQTFPLSEVPQTAPAAARAPRPRKAYGHAQEGPQDTGAGQ